MALDPQSTLIQLESLKLEKTPPAIKPRRSRSAWDVDGGRGILLDAAAHAEPPLVVFIVYDLPNRDCHAYASNGEICCAYNDDGTCDYDNSGDRAGPRPGRETNIFDTTSMFVYVHGFDIRLDEYKTTYVDPFAAILAEFEGVVPVALILEPDSLPNFATNLDDPRCGNIGTKNAYELGIAYAVEALKAAAPSAHIYLDAGHGGWLGWEDNLESFASTVASLGVEDQLRGFATNTANYQPLGEPCADGVDCITGPGASSACCDDPCGLLSQYNRGQNQGSTKSEIPNFKGSDLGRQNEHEYARLLVDAMAAAMPGFAPKVVIDSGRNGNPGARTDCASWCNPRDAGGRRAAAVARDPDAVDAYFWLKTPGESDGCTALLPSADDEWVSDGAGRLPPLRPGLRVPPGPAVEAPQRAGGRHRGVFNDGKRGVVPGRKGLVSAFRRQMVLVAPPDAAVEETKAGRRTRRRPERALAAAAAGGAAAQRPQRRGRCRAALGAAAAGAGRRAAPAAATPSATPSAPSSVLPSALPPVATPRAAAPPPPPLVAVVVRGAALRPPRPRRRRAPRPCPDAARPPTPAPPPPDDDAGGDDADWGGAAFARAAAAAGRPARRRRSRAPPAYETTAPQIVPGVEGLLASLGGSEGAALCRRGAERRRFPSCLWRVVPALKYEKLESWCRAKTNLTLDRRHDRVSVSALLDSLGVRLKRPPAKTAPAAAENLAALKVQRETKGNAEKLAATLGAAKESDIPNFNGSSRPFSTRFG
ncbi:cellulose 1,4-beta-cellobiosidase [Aureococcus anophagefferens]|nr:cellulose 1,4-beta-cellobiosidase [Aureococcus anophagefferens]